MKRNWDTIREILMALEANTTPCNTLQLSNFSSEDAENISYHVELLIESKLVDGEIIKMIGEGPHSFVITRLTWDGHEFLDAINKIPSGTRLSNSLPARVFQ